MSHNFTTCLNKFDFKTFHLIIKPIVLNFYGCFYSFPIVIRIEALSFLHYQRAQVYLSIQNNLHTTLFRISVPLCNKNKMTYSTSGITFFHLFLLPQSIWFQFENECVFLPCLFVFVIFLSIYEIVICSVHRSLIALRKEISYLMCLFD